MGTVQANRGWSTSYEDLLPSKHLSRITMLPLGSPEQRQHPLYRTKKCLSCDEDFFPVQRCVRGDLCPWAHHPEQLREPPEMAPDEFRSVVLRATLTLPRPPRGLPPLARRAERAQSAAVSLRRRARAATASFARRWRPPCPPPHKEARRS